MSYFADEQEYARYEALQASGNATAAIDTLLNLAAKNTLFFKVYFALARFAERYQDFALALTYYEKGLLYAPSAQPENLPYAKLCLERLRFVEAKWALEDYLQDKDNPNRARAEALLLICRDQEMADYQHFLHQQTLGGLCATDYAKRAENLVDRPTIHFIFDGVLDAQMAQLQQSLASLNAQIYGYWQAHIIFSGALKAPENKIQNTPQISYYKTYSDFLHAAFIHTNPADYCAFFPIGTLFAPECLLEVASYANANAKAKAKANTNWAFIYSDNDYFSRTAEGAIARFSPDFKPDFSAHFLRGFNYIGAFFARLSALQKAAIFAEKTALNAPFDLLLRVIETLKSEQIGHIAQILYHLPPSALAKLANVGHSADQNQNEITALEQHFLRQNIQASIASCPFAENARQISYAHPQTPKVSILIPTKNRLDLLVPCVESLLFHTSYPNFEIILIDNASDDANVFAYYATLAQKHPQKIRVLQYPHAFNYSAMNNQAAKMATGAYLLLLNNDIECIEKNWLSELMQLAQGENVGLVGARLIFPYSNKIQHAGEVLGMGQLAASVYIGAPEHTKGAQNHLQVTREVSAIIGACQLIKKDLFFELGMLDEGDFKVVANDIDLCLKVRAKNLLVLQTPFAKLWHHGSASFNANNAEARAQSLFTMSKDRRAFIQKWKHVLINDPFWSRHLSLRDKNASCERKFVVAWNADFADRPRILALRPKNADHATLLENALHALHQRGDLHFSMIAQAQNETLPWATELARFAANTLILSDLQEADLPLLESYASFGLALCCVLLVEDFSLENPVVRKAAALSSRIIVRGENTAKAWKKVHPAVFVLPEEINTEKALAKWRHVLLPQK